MDKPIIKTEDLRFSYTTAEGVSPVVLDGVDLDIQEGTFVAVLGHNGSGKSTLAKHMNAILLPSGGKVYVDGMDTADEARLLDDAPHAWAWCSRTRTTRSWPTWWRRMWPLPRRIWACPRRRSAAGWTTPWRPWVCTTSMTHAPHLLSGGQKQRIAIAGVIAMEPECIVLDEATAMLDPIGRQEVLCTVHTAEPGEGHHRGAHHPPHERGRGGRPGHGGHGQRQDRAGRRQPLRRSSPTVEAPADSGPDGALCHPADVGAALGL